jgi:hypothetical protein
MKDVKITVSRLKRGPHYRAKQFWEGRVSAAFWGCVKKNSFLQVGCTVLRKADRTMHNRFRIQHSRDAGHETRLGENESGRWNVYIENASKPKPGGDDGTGTMDGSTDSGCLLMNSQILKCGVSVHLSGLSFIIDPTDQIYTGLLFPGRKYHSTQGIKR